MTTLFTVLITLAIVGIILWVLDSVPMSPFIKKVIYAVTFIAILIWLAQTFLHIF